MKGRGGSVMGKEGGKVASRSKEISHSQRETADLSNLLAWRKKCAGDSWNYSCTICKELNIYKTSKCLKPFLTNSLHNYYGTSQRERIIIKVTIAVKHGAEKCTGTPILTPRIQFEALLKTL